MFDRGLPLILPAEKFPELREAGSRLVKSCDTVATDTPSDFGRAAMPFPQHASIETAFFQFIAAWSEALVQAGAESTPTRPTDPRVQQAVSLLQHDDHPIDELAARLSLSRSQLNRLFVQETGMTPRAYRQQRRITQLCLLLRQTDEPIKSIAYQNGFKRLSHFSAWFTQRVGVNPRTYRHDMGLV